MTEAFLVLLVVVPLVVLVAWGVLRYRRAQQFRVRGWEFSRDPGPRSVWGLNRPPFGRGSGREVRELVTGTVDGMAFRAVRYRSVTDEPPGLVAVLPLARSLPPAIVGATGARPKAPVGTALAAPEGLTLWADDPAWGRAVLDALGPTASALASANLAVSVDGTALVGLGAGGDAEGLAAALPVFVQAAQALDQPALQGFQGPPVPAEMSLVAHPDWVYRAQDDSMLDHVRATRGGFDHEALDVMFLAGAEVGFIALTHRWKTTRMVTEAGPNGTTTTRTVTDHHSEELLEITLGFPFVDLSVNKGFDWGRERVRFESDDFNRQFSVRCRDARFASNVFHPRQMQFLQEARPPAFAIQGRRLSVDHDGRVATIEWWLDFARGFFGRVPEFVWKDLGARPPQLMLRWLA